MALQVGKLFVTLDAETSNFMRGLSAALKSVEKFSNEVKKVAGATAQVTGALTAMAAGALALAATVDGPSKQALDSFKASAASVAVETTKILMPAIREVTHIFREFAGWLASLSPELRAQIGHYAALAAGVAVAAGALQKVSTIVGALAGLFSAVAGAMASIGIGPIFAVLAVVGALGMAIALLHKAWRENWGGINQIVQNAAQYLQDAFAGAITFVGKAWRWLIDQIKQVVMLHLEAADDIQKAFGLDLFDFAGVKSGLDGLFQDMKSGEVITNAVAAAKDLGTAASRGFLEEWKLIFKELGLDAAFEKAKKLFNARGQAHSGVDSSTIAYTGEQWTEAGEGPAKGGRLSGVLSTARAINAPNTRANVAVASNSAQRDKALADISAAGAAIGAGLMTVGRGLANKLGDFGGLMNSLMSGDVVGAIIELMSRTKAFASLVKVANGAFQMLVNAMEPLTASLVPALSNVVGVVTSILVPVLASLAPIFKFVADLLESLMPILVLVGMVLGVLGPILEMVGDALQLLMVVLKPVFSVLFVVIQGIGIGLLGMLRGILGVWNGIVSAVAGIVQGIISIFDPKAGAAAGAEIRKLMANTGAIDKQLADMLLVTEPAAMAQAKAATKAAEDLGEVSAAARDVTESLSNVPTGFRIALNRYGSTTDVQGGAHQPGDASVNINSVTVVTDDPAKFFKKLREASSTAAFQFSGSTMGNSKWGG